MTDKKKYDFIDHVVHLALFEEDRLLNEHGGDYSGLEEDGIDSNEYYRIITERVINTLKKNNNYMQEEPVSVLHWHGSSEMPKEKKVCLIRYSTNDGASTNNFEVVIAEPLTRRFVTRSYPHKTGYQHTIHGENTIKVDEYRDRREYIPFSDIDEWAYIDDLLNLSNVQRTVKNWKESAREELEKAAVEAFKNIVDSDKNSFLEIFKAGAKWQEKKDQETIETAIHHAYHNGRLEMKKQMMAKAIDAQCFGFQGAALFSFRLPSDNYLVGSKVKVIVIKED